MKGQNRSDVKPGKTVSIVSELTGLTCEGEVQEIITKSLYHPHGIKVRLISGEIGRVKTVKAGNI